MRALTKIALLAGFGAVTVHAQAPTPVESPNDPTTAVPVEATIELSSAEMTTGATKIAEQLEKDSTYVLHLKEMAKKQKDVIKVNCVNDRLVLIKVQRNIADGRKRELEASMNRDGDDRAQIYGTLVESGHAIRRLREEASACVGEPELLTSDSGVEVTHPFMPDDPVVDNPFDPGTEIVLLDVEPPGFASPYY